MKKQQFVTLLSIVFLAVLMLPTVSLADVECTNCHAMVMDGMKFCTECGQKVEPAGIPCVKCNAILPKDAKFCTECGEKVEPAGLTCVNCQAPLTVDAKFCTECGTKVEPKPLLCPHCQAEVTEGAKFCTSCGGNITESSAVEATVDPLPVTPTPIQPTTEPAPKKETNFGLNIESVTSLGDGTVSIVWADATRNPPYTVAFENYVSDDVESRAQYQETRWNLAEDYPESTLITPWLTPEQKVWIFVTDSNDNTATYLFTPQKAPVYSEFKVTVTHEKRYKEGDKVTSLEAFKASDIEATLETENSDYGFYAQLQYPMLAKERTYCCHTVITYPNGTTYSYTEEATTLPKGKSDLYWEFYSLRGALSTAISQYGEIPVGDYSFTVYFDGQFVTEFPFEIQ